MRFKRDMLSKYLIIFILVTICFQNGSALASNNRSSEDAIVSSKVHLKNVIAEHVKSAEISKDNSKLHVSRRKRADPDIKTFLEKDEIEMHQFLESYASKHDSHKGGDRQPTVDFDTVLKETVPFNSTDFS